MYFLPRTNKIFSWLAHQRIVYLYIGSLVFLMAVCMSWFLVVNRAIDAKIAYTDHQIKHLQNQKAELALIETANQKLEKRIALLATEFATTAKDSVDQARSITMLPQVINASQACKLTLKNCVLDTPIDGVWYTQTPILVAAHGSMDQIKQFFSALHKSGYMATVSNLSLMGDAQGGYSLQVALGFVGIKSS